MTSQQRFLDDVTEARAIRASVRSIIVHDKHVLVQQPADEPDSCYGFIGGRIELGETLEEQLCCRGLACHSRRVRPVIACGSRDTTSSGAIAWRCARS